MTLLGLVVEGRLASAVGTMDEAVVDVLLARAGIALEPGERERIVAASRLLGDAIRRVRAVHDLSLESATPFVHPDAP